MLLTAQISSGLLASCLLLAFFILRPHETNSGNQDEQAEGMALIALFFVGIPLALVALSTWIVVFFDWRYG